MNIYAHTWKECREFCTWYESLKPMPDIMVNLHIAKRGKADFEELQHPFQHILLARLSEAQLRYMVRNVYIPFVNDQIRKVYGSKAIGVLCNSEEHIRPLKKYTAESYSKRIMPQLSAISDKLSKVKQTIIRDRDNELLTDIDEYDFGSTPAEKEIDGILQDIAWCHNQISGVPRDFESKDRRYRRSYLYRIRKALGYTYP